MSTAAQSRGAAAPPGIATRLSEGLVRVERVASRLLVLGFVGLITANVGMRYIGGRPIVYAEELAAILLVWLAFVATSISIHDKTQIGVTLLTDNLPAVWQARVARGVNIAIAFLLLILLWKSVGWVRSPAVAFEQVITLGWPKWPFFLVVPVFCVTSLVHIAAQIVER